MATSTTLPILEISSICPPGNKQPLNWLVTKAPHRTVHQRMEAFVLGRIIILVRDPRSRSFIVSVVLPGSLALC